MPTRNVLMIIDPQEDFCNPQTGALYVQGAEKDMERAAELVRKMGDRFDEIVVTLDSHHVLHIAHPNFWVNPRGENPNPFTIITAAQVDAGEWSAAKMRDRKKSNDYIHKLEANGRYPLCIWPRHCLIGTPGHNVYAPLREALIDWELRTGKVVDKVTKGSNVYTEHYSAVKADVYDPEDPIGTGVNTRFIERVMNADMTWILGEARSHCVANTGTDVANEFQNDSFVSKLGLFTDGCSDVPGFEFMGEEFVKNMTARGMKTATIKDFLA
jgi:nicotinamidase-related amidase